MRDNEQIKSFGLIHEDVRLSDWVLGAEETDGGSVWDKLYTPDANGLLTTTQDDVEREMQRLNNGRDTNGCVPFSGTIVSENVSQERRRVDPDFDTFAKTNGWVDENDKIHFSVRRTAVGSGTDPNRGNSVTAVDDYIRKNFFCPETMWPNDLNLSLADWYSYLPTNVRDYGKNTWSYYGFESKYLPVSSNPFYSTPDQIWEGLQYGDVWVSVNGYYDYDANGFVCGTDLKGELDSGNRAYNHRVEIQAGQYGKYWIVPDHYLGQVKKFAWNYPFGSCKIIRIVKKNLLSALTQPFGIYGKDLYVLSKGGVTKGQALSFSDGLCPAADVYKSLFGDYGSSQPRQILNEKPANFYGSLTIN